MARFSGRRPAELDEGENLPFECQHVWLWFLDLHNQRPAGMGFCPISHQEMQAYFSLSGIRPEPWELNVLRELDRVARPTD